MAVVLTELGYHTTPYHMLANHSGAVQGGMGAQILSLGGGPTGSQVFSVIGADNQEGAQIRTSNVGHTLCQGIGYHTGPYHIGPYHGASICAGIGAQVEVKQLVGTGAQVRVAIYNTTNLRIMCSFPSRGDGTNWTSSSTEASTTNSFDILNVNSDIVEKYWRSSAGIKTGIQLDCDAGAGNSIFLDTLAFLNNNLTSSANVLITGSDNVGHAPAGNTINLTIDNTAVSEGNFVYISPTLPIEGYRYWRINIDDNTNSEDHIRIGTIVFGEAIIFNNECFVDRVKKIPVNFKDTVLTEAFTNVANDRGIKKRVRLDFRNIRFNGGNWDKLNDDVFNQARTILKCLWVPTPEFPLRFMTFAKLTRIPEENHNVKSEDKDYITFTIETDESL